MENGFRRIALAQGLLPQAQMSPPAAAPANRPPPGEADKPVIREAADHTA
jgi:hypothetical protein